MDLADLIAVGQRGDRCRQPGPCVTDRRRADRVRWGDVAENRNAQLAEDLADEGVAAGLDVAVEALDVRRCVADMSPASTTLMLISLSMHRLRSRRIKSATPSEKTSAAPISPISPHALPTNFGELWSTAVNGGHQRRLSHLVSALVGARNRWCPRQDSNLRTRLRRPMLSPAGPVIRRNPCTVRAQNPPIPAEIGANQTDGVSRNSRSGRTRRTTSHDMDGPVRTRTPLEKVRWRSHRGRPPPGPPRH